MMISCHVQKSYAATKFHFTAFDAFAGDILSARYETNDDPPLRVQSLNACRNIDVNYWHLLTAWMGFGQFRRHIPVIL